MFASVLVREQMTIRWIALLSAMSWLLGVAAPVRAQVSYPEHARYTVQRLGDEFGLGAVTVTAMGQDKKGYLWIGTQTGLYRYDGARAEKMGQVESMVGHYILDLVIAPDGTPWFAGNHGVAHYRDGRFEQLPIPASAMPLGNGTQLLAVDSQGTVFVVLFKLGVLRASARPGAAPQVLSQAEGVGEIVEGITRAEDDSIWFTFGGKLAHLEAGQTKAQVDSGIQIPAERVTALQWDKEKTLWLRTASRLAKLDPLQHRLSWANVAVGPADDVLGRPMLDSNGRMLVPSSTGLYWQHRSGEWTVITDKQGITSNDIQFAMEDREGTLWVAGSGTGLDRLPGVREWSAWTTAEGLPDNTVWATQRDRQGRLWVSTAHGIGVWDGHTKTWKKITQLGTHDHAQGRQLQVAADGSIWVLTVTGAVVRIDAGDFATTQHASYRGRPFQALAASPRGEIWATTHEHLVKFDTARPEREPEDVPLPMGEGKDILYLSFAPSGTLWAAGTGVVYRYDGKNWLTLTAKDGLEGQEITSMAALSDTELWVAYNDVVGVTRLVLEDGKIRSEHNPWDWLIVGRDSKGRVWFDGPDGLGVVSEDRKLQRLNHADGLVWDDVSPWTGVREEKDGSYLIATSRGLARYKPNGRERKAVPANVALTSVALGGVERRLGELPRVEPSEGSLTVQFTPLVLKNPEGVSCRYQLRGLDKQVTWTKLREMQFGGLPAGDYEFWVQCENPESAENGSAATFRFEVLPNIWQTWWAETAGGLLLLGGFWMFVSLRTRNLNRRQAELEKAVAERSAELMQKNKELQDASLTDPLTGTRNRRYFYETIETDIAQAKRAHQKALDPNLPGTTQDLIFVLLDIDRFKRVNDEFGHAAGDRLLGEVAKRIGSVMRRSDDLVRWGGEEFLLVCRTTDRANAGLLCDRVLEAIRELPFDVGNGVEIHKTCSIGWAPYPWFKDEPHKLSMNNVIELADKALYLAKREGRNRGYGLVPSENVKRGERALSIENLRDCPPHLVQIV